jgi:hypothetical protein
VVHVRISALDHPNVVAEDAGIIPGAASGSSIAKRLEKYGLDSPIYQSRVRGISPDQASDGLIRRVWLGEPPRQAFEDQLDVYRSYSTDAALAHWRDNGWICGEDPRQLADALVGAVRESNTTCLNLRLHAPGIDAAAVREQIAMLGAEVLPLVRERLRPT